MGAQTADAKIISLQLHRGETSTEHRILMSCSRTQRSASGEAGTRNPSISCQALYHDCTPQLGSILCRYDTCPTQYAPDAGYTICTSREHIVYGAFCGSTVHVFLDKGLCKIIKCIEREFDGSNPYMEFGRKLIKMI